MSLRGYLTVSQKPTAIPALAGYRFPWQSALEGIEQCPGNMEDHIQVASVRSVWALDAHFLRVLSRDDKFKVGLSTFVFYEWKRQSFGELPCGALKMISSLKTVVWRSSSFIFFALCCREILHWPLPSTFTPLKTRYHSLFRWYQCLRVRCA